MPCVINTRTELMTHQREAVSKMMETRVGALFMEDGTGRTRTAIELVKLRSSRISNVVWFCPYSIRRNIRDEIEKHCGRVDDFWNVISMESMSASIRGIIMALHLINERSYVIVDESHYIKGPHAKRSLRIIRASAKAYYRLILSGTPVTQGVQDLFNQFLFLSDKILGYKSFYAFSANHLEYSAANSQKVIRAHNLEYLTAKMEPYVFQATRKECGELPMKLHTIRYFKMSREQREYYQDAKRDILENLDSSANTVFLLFIRLQQILSGFRIQPDGSCGHLENTRLAALENLLYSLPQEARIVIWAKFKYDIEAIQALLPREQAVVLHGDISPDEREKKLELFRREKRFLLVNEKVGKYNIDLNCADIVVFYNNTFSYTERLRAENLSRMPGQRKKILYVDLICSHSIDERILLCLSRKNHAALAFQEKMNTIKNKSDRQKWIEDL